MLLTKAIRDYCENDEISYTDNYINVIRYRISKKLQKLEQEIELLMKSDLLVNKNDQNNLRTSVYESLSRIYHLIIEKIDTPVIGLNPEAYEYLISIQELRDKTMKEKISDERILEKALKNYYSIMED